MGEHDGAGGLDERYAAVLAEWPAPVHRITVDGVRARSRVLLAGPVDAPRTLCLAGAGDTAAAWFAQARDLTRGHRMVAPDLPGDAGGTVRRVLRGTVGLVDWVAEVLDGTTGTVGAPEPGERVDVLAHSYGARIAVAFALARPERVRSLVLLDPTGVFAGIRPVTALRAVPLLVAPTGPRLRAYSRWETADRWPPTAAFGALACAAADGPRPRLVIPRRPASRRFDALRDLPGGVEVVLAERGRYHDPARIARLIERRHPWIRLRSLPVAHHELPFRYRPE